MIMLKTMSDNTNLQTADGSVIPKKDPHDSYFR